VFGSTFSSVKAVEHVMANLNSLRGPIAHCSPLAEDEIVRLPRDPHIVPLGYAQTAGIIHLLSEVGSRTFPFAPLRAAE
jgi:hypothetical protein